MKRFCSLIHHQDKEELSADMQFTSRILYSNEYRLLACDTGHPQQLLLFLSLCRRGNETQTLSGENVTIERKDIFRFSSRRLLQRKLRTFYTFTIAENPLERVLREYKTIKDKRNISLTFNQFIDHQLNLSNWERELVPSIITCLPCQVQYQFYANTKMLEFDMKAIFQIVGIPVKLYKTYLSLQSKQRSLLPHSEKELKRYYSKLDPYTRNKLFEMISLELNYYYSLYPEETGIHLYLSTR